MFEGELYSHQKLEEDYEQGRDSVVWCVLNGHGRVGRKPVIANPRLNVNRSINFSCLKMFSLLLFWVV